MIYRTGPNTSISQILTPSPSPTLVSRASYFFVFGLQDSTSTHFLNESIYVPHLHYGWRNQTEQDEMREVPLVPCSEDLLPSDPLLEEYFLRQASNLSDLYCISKEAQDELMIEGAWDQVKFSYLRLFIEMCQNDTKCEDQALIREKLHTSYFAFYSTDNLFDMLDFKEPAKLFGRDYFIETSDTVKKILTWYLRTTELNSDEGWLSEAVSSTDYFAFDSIRESFEISSDYLIDMVIRKSVYETILTRKYKKFQNVFAEMTGFLQVIFIGLYVISSPFIQKEYVDTLTNSIYNFEVDEEPERKMKARKKGKRKTMEHSEKLKSFKTLVKGTKEAGSEPNIENLDSKQKKKDDRLMEYLMKVQESPLKMSTCEYFRSLFWKGSTELEIKQRQRKKGISSIFSQLDIKFVLKKFAELEKLKMLMLNEDQYHLFEYLPKPLIMKNAKINFNYVKKSGLSPKVLKSVREKKESKFIIADDLMAKAQTVQKAFESIAAKQALTEIDRKLIEGLDENILRLLEKSQEDIILVKKAAKETEQSLDLEKPSVYEENTVKNVVILGVKPKKAALNQ